MLVPISPTAVSNFSRQTWSGEQPGTLSTARQKRSMASWIAPSWAGVAEISSVSWARARALVARQGLLNCTIRAKDAVKGRQLKDDFGLVTRPGNAEVSTRQARCLEAPY